MNDFPVMRKGLWDRQGANIASRCKEMYDMELAASLEKNAAFCRDFVRCGGG